MSVPKAHKMCSQKTILKCGYKTVTTVMYFLYSEVLAVNRVILFVSDLRPWLRIKVSLAGKDHYILLYRSVALLYTYLALLYRYVALF